MSEKTLHIIQQTENERHKKRNPTILHLSIYPQLLQNLHCNQHDIQTFLVRIEILIWFVITVRMRNKKVNSGMYRKNWQKPRPKWQKNVHCYTFITILFFLPDVIRYKQLEVTLCVYRRKTMKRGKEGTKIISAYHVYGFIEKEF